MNDFAALFKALTGNRPFPWQSVLYDRFTAGMFPNSASIPTGLGKTSVVAVWLIALAKYPAIVPRRLVYVVNRRTVVDQTTAEVENLRKNLVEQDVLAELAANLNGLAALPCDSPLAISTLRGQFADNGDWRRDPARPAVIIGTVDMIGSGLLFSRYNASFRMRPLHAGLLGQDTLVVHDEAHLEPAFQTLLAEIAAVQNGGDSKPSSPRDFKPLRVMALTATSRSDVAPFSLTNDDRANAIVKKRFEAVKELSLIELGKDDRLEDKIAEKAKDLNGAVLIFVRSVETALRIVDALDKGERKGHVISLTGTMRGKERDDLVKDPRFRHFLNAVNTENTFLVATSAGEVGVNISADRCVCDLATYESMAQRFGRVNRFGACADSTITVFHETVFGRTKPKSKEIVKTPMDTAREKTLAVLKTLNGDASPKALSEHPAPEAFSPPPEIRVATGIQFDAWALTSIRAPTAARPPVAPYLHGEPLEWQPSETHLAWRNDIDFQRIVDREGFLDTFPLRPKELLRDVTKRIAATLEKMLKGRNNLPPAWLVSENGSVSLYPLSDFDKGKAESDLADATLILPLSLGGLENGLFTGKGSASDVSYIIRSESSARNAKAEYSLDISGEDDDEPHYLNWSAPSAPLDTVSPTPATGAVSLTDHAAAVTANARAIAAKLHLPSDLQSAIINAAEHHDDGKARREWQRAIGNHDFPKTVLAKSAGGPRATAENYRHEFGSLATLSGLSAHCVAAHHGRARPHFSADEVFDPATAPAVSAERAALIPLRFAALQHKYGRWGLAYLESILRAADYAASAGIVANVVSSSPAQTSQVEISTPTPTDSDAVQLALDPANPGHFFACCGLFELASRLYPEATAYFDGNRFIISAPTTFANLFGEIKVAPINTLDPDDAKASPLFIGAPFNLRIDWWKTASPSTSALKVWAGTMEAPRIVRAMQNAIDITEGNYILFDSRIVYDVADASKKVEPYYFDANRGPNSDSCDVGFSPNDLGLETLAAPAVEFLCLVGLQRAIPYPIGDRLFDYHLWSTPIPVSLLAAAVNGFIQPENHPAFRFESWYRTSQRKHKAFLTAKSIQPQTKDPTK